MGTTALLSAFITDTRPESIPAEVKTAALRPVLDCIGVGLAAVNEPGGRIITDIIREAGGNPQTRIIGTDIATSSIHTAWADGSLFHLLDYDDTGFSHPTATILPAALAAAEHAGATGNELLTAIIIGYEVFERLSVSARPYEATLRARGYHPTSLYGAPAGAAAAARLLGLSAKQTAVALGLSVAATNGFTQHFGTWGKGLQAGTPARAALTGVLLAARDYWADEEVLEGRYGFYNAVHGEGNYDLSHIGDDLGNHWAIVDPGLTIKNHPSCGATLRSVDAALELHHEHALDFLNDVERVEVETQPGILNTLRHPHPVRGFQAKFSLNFAVAAPLLDGRLDNDSYTDDYLHSDRVQEALRRTTTVLRPEWANDETKKRHQPLTVYLKDGRVLRRVVANPKGSIANPHTRDELLTKYRENALRALPQEQVERSIERIEGLDDLPSVNDLIDQLVIADTVN